MDRGGATNLVEPTERDGSCHGNRAGAPDPHTTLRRVPGTTRRSALSAIGVGSAAVAIAACTPQTAPPTPPGPPVPTTATLPPHPVPWPIEQARLLANRATFGATAAVVERITTIGAEAWVDEQLAATGATAESMLAGYRTLSATNAQNDAQRSVDESVLFNELDHAMLLRGVHSENQLYEVMCDFWSNHFNIWRSAKYLTQLKTSDDRDVIRPNALGRFVDLLLASGRSPAMLVYLDNYVSNAKASNGLNENWGRELLELHTLGIIEGRQVYGEADVRAVATVMAGRTINWASGGSKYSYRFNDAYASGQATSLLGGQWSRPTRTTAAQREADGDSLLTFLARHPSTARHLAFKLCRRFVSDDPPASLVDRLAEVYTANDTAIRPVLRTLLLSEELRASADRKVKRPVEWLHSSLRALNARVDPLPSGQAASRLRGVQEALGQPVNGRASPDGYPETAARWVSADGLLKRWEKGALLARNRITDAGAAAKVVVDLAALLPAPLPAGAQALVVAIADRVLQLPLSPTDASTILSALGVNPGAAATAVTSNTATLQATFGLLLAHPSFQRR